MHSLASTSPTPTSTISLSFSHQPLLYQPRTSALTKLLRSLSLSLIVQEAIEDIDELVSLSLSMTEEEKGRKTVVNKVRELVMAYQQRVDRPQVSRDKPMIANPSTHIYTPLDRPQVSHHIPLYPSRP